MCLLGPSAQILLAFKTQKGDGNEFVWFLACGQVTHDELDTRGWLLGWLRASEAPAGRCRWVGVMSSSLCLSCLRRRRRPGLQGVAAVPPLQRNFSINKSASVCGSILGLFFFLVKLKVSEFETFTLQFATRLVCRKPMCCTGGFSFLLWADAAPRFWCLFLSLSKSSVVSLQRFTQCDSRHVKTAEGASFNLTHVAACSLDPVVCRARVRTLILIVVDSDGRVVSAHLSAPLTSRVVFSPSKVTCAFWCFSTFKSVTRSAGFPNICK